MNDTIHYAQCPLHEDYELTDSDVKRIDPNEVFDLVRAADGGYTPGNNLVIRKALRPFGWLLDCKCDEIAQAEKEYQQEMRYSR